MTVTAAADAEPDVTPADVATWLRQQVDNESASMCIDAAMLACRAVLSPIPATARPIVVAVAARAYVNPTAANTSGEGPFSAGWTRVGVYLTDDERVSLLAASPRAAGTGGGGAFTIDPTPPGVVVPQLVDADLDGDGDGWGYYAGTTTPGTTVALSLWTGW